MSSNTKMLLGFVAGVAAGAGVYALLKSEEGQELIAELKDTAEKWKDEIEKVIKKSKKATEDMAAEFNEMGDETIPA